MSRFRAGWDLGPSLIEQSEKLDIHRGSIAQETGLLMWFAWPYVQVADMDTPKTCARPPAHTDTLPGPVSSLQGCLKLHKHHHSHLRKIRRIRSHGVEDLNIPIGFKPMKWTLSNV